MTVRHLALPMDKLCWVTHRYENIPLGDIIPDKFVNHYPLLSPHGSLVFVNLLNTSETHAESSHL